MVGLLVLGADIILVTTQIWWSLLCFSTLLGMPVLILPVIELFVLNAHKPHII